MSSGSVGVCMVEVEEGKRCSMSKKELILQFQRTCFVEIFVFQKKRISRIWIPSCF